MASTFKQKCRNGISKLKETVSFVWTDITTHWNKPGRGNYVPYKEVLNYSIGGMGQNMVVYLLGFMALGVTNTLFASTIGIRPMHLQTMLTVQTIANIFFQIIRGKLVDNTNTRWGRFRPYMAIMGAPLVILSTVFIFLPFETMDYNTKYMMVFIFAIAISAGQPLFQTNYTNLGSVLSPSSRERANIITVSSIIYSFAPSVYQLFVPIFSEFTGGFTDIRTYKYIVVPIGILGVFLSLFAFFGCKERIVSSKHFVQKVSVVDGCIAVWKNKYWWLRTVSTWFTFLESAYLVLFGWIYIYGTQDMVTYGILTTVLGTASGLSMFATPFILKALGNKGTLLFHNGFNIIFIACMLATYEVPLLYFLFLYINTFINQLQLVYNPVLNAEVKDSIQLKSGKRVDFMLEVAALIGTPITIATGYFLPFIYEGFGLTVNYDVLYDPTIRNNLFYMLCALSIAGAALNLAPFLLYNLTREKHAQIITALKIRAINEDYRTGDVTPHQAKDAIESYNYSMERKNAVLPDIKEKKTEMKAVKAEYKLAKAAYETALKAAAEFVPSHEAVMAMPEIAALSAAVEEAKAAYEAAKAGTDAAEIPVKEAALKQAEHELKTAVREKEAIPQTEELAAATAKRDELKKAYKEAKFAYKDAQKLKRDKEAIAEFLDPELNKWSLPLHVMDLEIARAITAIDKNDIAASDLDISALPVPEFPGTDERNEKGKLTTAAKEMRTQKRETLALIRKRIRQFKKMRRLTGRMFPDGVLTDYEADLKRELDVQCETKEQKKVQNKVIKKAEKAYHRFARAYKLYLECETVITEYNDRNNFFDFILPKYEEYLAQAAQIDAEEAAKAAAEKLEKKREIKRLKAEKAMKKVAARQAKMDGVKFTEEYFEQYKADHAQELEEASRLPEDDANGVGGKDPSVMSAAENYENATSAPADEATTAIEQVEEIKEEDKAAGSNDGEEGGND